MEQDKSNIEAKICQIRDRDWFMHEGDRECYWAVLEGKMSPKFLHLEDISSNLSLKALEINGELTEDLNLILDKLNNYYTQLYST